MSRVRPRDNARGPCCFPLTALCSRVSSQHFLARSDRCIGTLIATNSTGTAAREHRPSQHPDVTEVHLTQTNTVRASCVVHEHRSTAKMNPWQTCSTGTQWISTLAGIASRASCRANLPPLLALDGVLGRAMIDQVLCQAPRLVVGIFDVRLSACREQGSGVECSTLAASCTVLT